SGSGPGHRPRRWMDEVLRLSECCLRGRASPAQRRLDRIYRKLRACIDRPEEPGARRSVRGLYAGIYLTGGLACGEFEEGLWGLGCLGTFAARDGTDARRP